MVVKVYVSGISGNKEVKKRQQRVLLILDSKNIPYEIIDIAEPGAEDAKDFMQNNSTSLGSTIGDPNPRHPLPPQIFNEDEYCGDYDAFDMANEIDEMEKFLKVETAESSVPQPDSKITNGDVAPEEKTVEESTTANGETAEDKTEEKQEEAVTADNEEKKSEDVGDSAKTNEDEQEEKEEDKKEEGTDGAQESEEKQIEKPENETEKAEDDAGDFWDNKDD